MTEQTATSTHVAADKKTQQGGKAVVGPLTVRDVAVLAGAFLILVASVLPLTDVLGGRVNLWTTAGLFFVFIGILLPLTVAALFVVRRVSPGSKPRIGSLSLDQFASVVASFAAAFFLSMAVTTLTLMSMLGSVGALILLAATVAATIIPVFAADFAGRSDVPAHTVARDAVAPAKRPAAPKPVLALPAGNAGGQAPHGSQQGIPGPGQPGVGQAGAGQAGAGQAGAAQAGGRGWQGARQGGHAPAGQIFTPAGTTPAPAGGFAAGSAGAADAAGAGVAGAGAGVAGAAAGANAAGTNGGVAGGAPAATSVQSQVPAANGGFNATGNQAQPTSTHNPFAAPEAASSAQASQQAEPMAGVVLPESQGSPETRLNPQLNESAAQATNASLGAAKPVAEQSIGATVNPHGAKVVNANPFWFAVDRPQNVIDEASHKFVFKLVPGNWNLAMEDRGDSFLVQDSDGKTGVLLDLVGIERAPETE